MLLGSSLEVSHDETTQRYLLFLVLSNAFGQEQSAQSPQPGPEVQKLAYYVGTGKGEGEAKASSFGSGGKRASGSTAGSK